MSETKKSDQKRCSGFVEVKVCKADNYEAVTRKIAEWIELSLEDDQYLALFTLILNKELKIELKGHG